MPTVRARGTRCTYAMMFQWSNEDQAYVVSFPEWEATGLYFVHTHGDTYE
jgi:antitoxin HicB